MPAPSVVIQTTYAELLERASAAAFRGAFPKKGTFVSKLIKRRRYWYFQNPSESGKTQTYVGPETPELLQKIDRHRDERDDELHRRSLVSTLIRSLGGPRPSHEIGDVVAALAKAGVFRLRGVLIGTVAFQTYAPMLGKALVGAILRTDDVDIAQFRSVSVAVGDRTPSMLDVLKDVDDTFRPVPHQVDGRKTTRYQTARELRVDFLTPNEGPDTGTPQQLPALRTDAEPLRFLDFLIRDPEPAVVLHEAGLYVQVPSPPRFAVHKMIVARRRAAGNPKREKDLRQAGALVEVLAEQRPFELREAWTEAYGRGRTWRQLLLESLTLLASRPRDMLLKTIGEPRSIVPTANLRFPPSPGRYDGIRNAVFFDAVDHLDTRIICSVTGEALGDHFGGLDIGPEIHGTFLQNRFAIESAARVKYLSAPIEVPGEVHLRTDDFSATRR